MILQRFSFLVIKSDFQKNLNTFSLERVSESESGSVDEVDDASKEKISN